MPQSVQNKYPKNKPPEKSNRRLSAAAALIWAYHKRRNQQDFLMRAIDEGCICTAAMHTVCHTARQPPPRLQRDIFFLQIFSCYSRSYPAQPRTSVVSKPEQNLVLLVRDPGTPHVQSVPELTGHFSTGRCPLSLTRVLGWAG